MDLLLTPLNLSCCHITEQHKNKLCCI